MKPSSGLIQIERSYPASSSVRSVTFLMPSHPSYAQGYYDRDNDFYLKWDKISESTGAVKSYLDEWVHGVHDRDEYWQKLGPETQKRLKVNPKLSQPVNYGEY